MMRHLWTVIVLLLLVVLSGWVTGTVGLAWLPEPWLVGVGVMILSAYAFGEALSRIGLPALLGYITVGIIMGPSFAALMPLDYPLEIITDEMVAHLALIQVLIVGVIGMLAGGKFRLADLSGNRNLLLAIAATLLVVVVTAVMAAVLLAGQIFSENLVFLSGQILGVQLTIALFFGLLAFGLSPSITVAILQELRARGPLGTVILGVVIVTELILFALFSAAMAVARAIEVDDGFSPALVWEALPTAAWELTLSVVLGLLLGLVTAIYLRFIRREMLLFVLAALVLTYFGVQEVFGQDAVAAAALLTFLVAGFFVQNLTQQGDLLVRALERIALPVFVVYFATVAAGIDLEGTLAYAPLVVILIATRVAALYWGVRWASRKAAESNRSYEYLRNAFYSQDAVVLVLAGVVAAQFPEWGAQFQSVLIATVVAYLIFGPVFLKVSLERSGESTRSRRPLQATEVDLPEDDVEVPGPEVFAELFESPRFEDSWLHGHIDDLREELMAQCEAVFYAPVLDQYRKFHDDLGELDVLVENQLPAMADLVERIEEGLTGSEVRDVIGELQQNYSRGLLPLIRRIEETPGAGVDADSMMSFFEAIRQIEDKESLYRIEREDSLLEPAEGDGPPQRALKALRRLRTKVAGRGYRTVAVGRLWRFYVDLAVPIALGRRAPQVMEYYEKFWRRLWRHLRSLDEFWSELIAEIGRAEEATATPAGSGSSDEEIPRYSAEAVQQRITRSLQEFRDEQEQLNRLARSNVILVLRAYAEPVADCYATFLDAAHRAGTISLPAYFYRPSSRYGQSKRTEARLADRLERHEGVVSGYRGWIRLDHELSSFAHWADLFGDHIEETVTWSMGKGWRKSLEEIIDVCRADLPESEIEESGPSNFENIYREEIRPRMAGFRKEQEELLARFHKGLATRSLQRQLEARIAKVPKAVSVLASEPEKLVLTGAGSHYELPLRQWLATQVGREMALRVGEINERSEKKIENRLAMLSSVEQILEFNLVTAQKEQGEMADGQQPEQVAKQGLQRATDVMEAYLKDTIDQEEELRVWLETELGRIVHKAFDPIWNRRLGEVQRELARLEAASFVARGESWLSDSLEPVTRRLRKTRGRLRRWTQDILSELRGLLVDESERPDRFAIRRLLYADEPAARSKGPAVYRRLFVPVPLDIPEFYRGKEGAEERILDTVRQFFSGAEHSILISGPPGTGKRTFVQHLVPGRIYAVTSGLREEQISTIRLNSAPRREAELSALIGRELLGRKGPPTFEELATRIKRRQRSRQVVVVENAERVVLRTEEGLQRTRRFFELIAATSDQVLWIVVMNKSAATYLSTHIELETHFTHHEQLMGMNVAELESMIMARHKVSGFDLEFRPPDLGRIQRLRQPIVGPEARAIPRRLFFERLEAMSGGNPRAALLYWLKSVESDPVDEARLLVSPLPQKPINPVEPLSLRQILILTSLSLHSTMSPVEICRVLDEEIEDIRRELRHLTRLGFLARVPDTPQDYQIRSIASAWVERDLRRRNLI